MSMDRAAGMPSSKNEIPMPHAVSMRAGGDYALKGEFGREVGGKNREAKPGRVTAHYTPYPTRSTRSTFTPVDESGTVTRSVSTLNTSRASSTSSPIALPKSYRSRESGGWDDGRNASGSPKRSSPLSDSSLRRSVADEADGAADDLKRLRLFKNDNVVLKGSGVLSRNKANALTGLRNLGNTCFMNSCVQCLSHCPEFGERFAEASQGRTRSTRDDLAAGKVAKSFASLMENLWNDKASSKKCVSAADLKSEMHKVAPYFRGYGQHDAHEYLRVLLDALHTDTNRIKVKPAYKEEKDDDKEPERAKFQRLWESYLARNCSIVTDTFCGQLQSIVQCEDCRKIFTAYDAFWDLSLPIPRPERATLTRTSKRAPSNHTCTLDDCLAAFTAEEILSDNESYYCSNCKTHVEARKKFSIARFPKVLVIHLKRFSHGTYIREKLNTTVQFPLEGLSLDNYVCDDFFVEVPDYHLIAVSNHMGGLHGGHYTASCKNSGNGKWYTFNDSSVSEQASDSIVSSSSYVLFYAATEIL